MSGHRIIVVGASAGGVEAVTQLINGLPPDLTAAIFIVLHIPPQVTSYLPQILNRSIKKRYARAVLEATHPYDGEPIQNGRIYVAPPDHHLLVKEGYIRLARGPKENSHRPAIDPLFRTAARAYGRQVVGLILSGALDDGTAGLAAVKQRGGVAIVQDPEEALYSGMPNSAIKNVEVDHILPVSEIAPVLVELADKLVETEREEAISSDMEIESDMAELEIEAVQKSERPGTPSPFGCPDCGGVLWELGEGKLIRFRCRTGHAHSTGSLMAEQSEALEDALWKALRALEEKATLALKMANRARDRKQPLSAKRFEEQGQDSQKRAKLIREMLLKGESNGHVVRSQLPAGVSLFPVVAIAASTGGLKALSKLLSDLPANFPAAIVIVQHLSPQHPSHMAEIIGGRTTLAVKQVEVGDLLQPGKVYIAPPDQHLLVESNRTLSLSQSELVHFVRPSADLLFESVAASFKEWAISVTLTGRGRDGAMGVQAIKKMGGTVIAQDKATSECFGMPEAAIDTGSVDLVLPLNEIANTLVNLVNTTMGRRAT